MATATAIPDKTHDAEVSAAQIRADNAWKPKANIWAIALTVTLATFMEVLDTSIANVALPHIAGSLGASQDEATWVLTSYLVANAVILPASAYLTTFIGRKKFYMICVVLFGLSSMACGLAPSLPILIFCRILQGAGGGGLAPSEQAILADTFTPKQRGQAFALYGLAVVCAPAIGPSLGGWITDNYDWRWVFFINVPIALLSLFLTNRLVEDPPHVVREVKESKKGGLKLDLFGFGLLATGFGSLEFVLDKGQEDDWFGSHVIAFFCGVLHRVAGDVDFLGTVPVEGGQPADSEPDAVQAEDVCDSVCADVCAGLYAVRDDGADSAICTNAAGVYGGAGGLCDFAGRRVHYVDDAGGGHSDRADGPAAG